MSAIVDTLTATLQSMPDNWQCRLALIEALVAEERNEEAYAVMSDVTELPSDVESCVMAGQAYGLIEPSSGIEILDGVIAADPMCATAYLEKAKLCYRAGDIESANRQYVAAITFDPALAEPEFAGLLGVSGTEEEVPVRSESTYELDDSIPPQPVDRSEVVFPEPGEYPTIPLSEAMAVTNVAPLVHPDEVPGHPGFAYREEAHPVDTVHTDEEHYRESLHNVEVHTAAHQLGVEYDYQNPDDSIFEPTITPDDIYVGALVTDTGEPVANLQESIRRNKVQKEAEIAQREKVAKIQSVTVAFITLAAVCLMMIFAVVAVPRPSPPQIVASSIVAPSDESLEVSTIKHTRITPTPKQSASAMSMEVMTVASASDISMMSFDAPSMDLGAASFGTDFGSSMSFGDTTGGGMVSFFGSKTKAQKVVFVVDASASMKSKGSTGKTKMALMKEELIKTVEALPTGIEFQILFFSGPSWFLGEDPKKIKKDWTRHPKGNFWEYKGGNPDKWPKVRYIKSSPSRMKKTIEEIKATPMVLGTDWRDPLKMAMKMEPDTIYFMTDGAVGKHPDKPPVVQDVLDFNKKHSKAKINAVCLMVLKAADNLKALADGTKGEFTLVLEDGTSLRGRDLDKLMRK